MAKPRAKELDSAESLVRAGQVELARSRVASLSRRKSWQPDQRWQLAETARLSHLPEVTCKLLRRQIDRGGAGRNEEVVSQYAAALTQLGAPREALRMMNEFPEPTGPTRLFRAFAHQALWQHEAAIAELKKNYVTAVLRVDGAISFPLHLARSLIGRSWGEDVLSQKEAHALLDIAIRDVNPDSQAFMRDLAWLTRAEAYLFERRPELALQALESLASVPMSGRWPVFGIRSRTWSTIARWMLEPTRAEFGEELALCRAELERAEDWENVRLSDWFRARLTGDVMLASAVVHGTPYPEFRAGAKLLPAVPETYEWTPPAAGSWVDPATPALVIDASLGAGFGEGQRLKQGQTLHRLFLALCSDHYRPATPLLLHELVIGGRVTSPDLATRLMIRHLQRLQTWLVRVDAPVRVEPHRMGYRLVSVRPCRVLLRDPMSELSADLRLPVSSRFGDYLDALRSAFGTEIFSAAQASKVIGRSTRSVAAYLTSAAEKGLVERMGAASQTRYRFR